MTNGPTEGAPPWSAMSAVLDRELPGATVTQALGLSEDGAFTEIRVGRAPLLNSYGSSVGASVMVSDDVLPLGLIGISKSDAARASAMLRRGGMVAFTTSEARGDVATVLSHTFDADTGADTGTTRTKAPTAFVTVPPTWSGPAGVISSGVAAELAVEPTTVALAVTGIDITQQQEESVNEGLAAVSQLAGIYVERGYQADDATRIARIVLIVLGAVLMLGGTLTATFLALSDARPDLATLSAVGASPRTRRSVAAAYAVVVGAVGAFMGAAVGFIPGVAVTWPLTGQGYSSGSCSNGCSSTNTGPFLDVPWLMVIALVVVLPLVTALVVGLSARSRLPLVARLD
jgi:putative ABC transport system permease protein